MSKRRLLGYFLLGVVLTVGIVTAATSVYDVPQSGTVPYGVDNGPTAYLTGDINISGDFVDGQTLDLDTNSGNITFHSNGDTNLSIDSTEITGPWTNITSVTAGSTWIEISPEDKPQVDTRGDVNALSIYETIALDDDTADFYYAGTDGGTVSVRLYSLPANTKVAALDANTLAPLDSGTADSNGNITFDLPASDHTVLLSTDSTDDTPQFANPDPTGVVSDTPNELSVDVSDADFPSDEVNVSIYLDGAKIHSENITSNSTVTTSNFGTLDLGDHTWAVNATDYYGNQNSESYDFTLPSNITLRNETNASQIITGKNITAKFYSSNGDVVVQKSDSNNDGNISLRGLPNTEFVVVFEGDDYHDRRAYIESIVEQQNFYLLNSTAFPLDNGAVFTRFVYEDRTGSFPQSDTTLRVQRAVDPNNDSTYQWETIAGDYWGAAGEFPFTGEYNERYRLLVKNQETNESRILGTHIPVASGSKNIIVGQIVFEAENATGRYYDAVVNENTSNLQVYYQDPTNKTTNLNIVVYERGNQSNELYNSTVSGPLGEHALSIPLSEDEETTNWVVKFDGQHASDTSGVYGEVLVGDVAFPLPLDAGILAAFSYAFVTFIMLLYGPRTATIGAWAGVLVFIGLVFVGWIPGGIVVIVLPVIAAAGGTIYKEAVP